LKLSILRAGPNKVKSQIPGAAILDGHSRSKQTTLLKNATESRYEPNPASAFGDVEVAGLARASLGQVTTHPRGLVDAKG